MFVLRLWTIHFPSLPTTLRRLMVKETRWTQQRSVSLLWSLVIVLRLALDLFSVSSFMRFNGNSFAPHSSLFLNYAFNQEFFVQAMWAAPLCQSFLHLLYDKEILDESVILMWYSRKPAGGEDSGFEPQRKQLRQQVRYFCHAMFVSYPWWTCAANIYRSRPTPLFFNTTRHGL